MDNQTKAIDTPFGRRDAYGALSMPVYHTAAYEFDTAADMADAFTPNRSLGFLCVVRQREIL